jgi:hypothetical protein
MSTALTTTQAGETLDINSEAGFALFQRRALGISKSTLIPKDFQNNVPNVMIALEMANRIGAGPLAVLQNLYVVHGKPSWSSQFIISVINTCGRFWPLRFDVKGSGDKMACIAWTQEKMCGPMKQSTLDQARKENAPILESPPVTMEMAKKEGWVSKSGSKWQTMPELMIRYRAATFFGRLYAPELLMGMSSQDELEDIAPPAKTKPAASLDALAVTLDDLSDRIAGKGQPAIEHDEANQGELADDVNQEIQYRPEFLDAAGQGFLGCENNEQVSAWFDKQTAAAESDEERTQLTTMATNARARIKKGGGK